MKEKKELDEEWIRLIDESKKAGVTKKNVQAFLKEKACRQIKPGCNLSK